MYEENEEPLSNHSKSLRAMNEASKQTETNSDTQSASLSLPWRDFSSLYVEASFARQEDPQ
jgi:hypothetical protein